METKTLKVYRFFNLMLFKKSERKEEGLVQPIYFYPVVPTT